MLLTYYTVLCNILNGLQRIVYTRSLRGCCFIVSDRVTYTNVFIGEYKRGRFSYFSFWIFSFDKWFCFDGVYSFLFCICSFELLVVNGADIHQTMRGQIRFFCNIFTFPLPRVNQNIEKEM